MMEDAGQKLKKVRERLNLRYRDVEDASLRIAEKHQSDEFVVALSRLSDIENKGTVPSIYRLYSLCAIYRLDFQEVLEWYGVQLGEAIADSRVVEMEHTHLYGFSPEMSGDAQIPFSIDPGLDVRRTSFLSRMIQRWGRLPLALLGSHDLKSQRYGYIGTDDWTMYPLIQPGSLVLIDETETEIATSGWGNEQERPVYFIEHRKGYSCGWCSRVGEQVILQPHPISQVEPTIFDAGEIDIIGRVNGVAMRLNPPRRRRTRS